MSVLVMVSVTCRGNVGCLPRDRLHQQRLRLDDFWSPRLPMIEVSQADEPVAPPVEDAQRLIPTPGSEQPAAMFQVRVRW